MGQPVQIVIPSGVNWETVNFQFRVPVISSSMTNTGELATFTNSGIILWTFGYSGASLYASGETQIFKFSDIKESNTTRSISTYSGLTNTGVISTFGNFYNAVSEKC